MLLCLHIALFFEAQTYNWLCMLKTCLKNVMIPALKLGKYTYKEVEERAYAKLDALGLKDQALKPASKLSGGQQQRVSIARALINDPIEMADGKIISHNKKG